VCRSARRRAPSNAVRALIAFLLIAAAAVTLALLFRLDTGYVLFVTPPYRIELSQNAFILIAILGFVALYALIRAAVRLSRLPEDVREGRRRRQFERFRNKQDAAVVALLEGRHGKARQFAEEALAIPLSSPVAALVGARAALETRDYATAKAMLERPDAQATNLAVPRLMLDCEVCDAEEARAGRRRPLLLRGQRAVDRGPRPWARSGWRTAANQAAWCH